MPNLKRILLILSVMTGAFYCLSFIYYCVILDKSWLNHNMFHDFYCFYTAGKAALAKGGAAPYSLETLKTFQQAMIETSGRDGVAWFYPPLALLGLGATLSFFDFKTALFIYYFLQTALYFWIGMKLLKKYASRNESLILLFGFPPFWNNFLASQNGVFVAFLLGGGLLLLNKKPFLSGFYFGILTFKPQMGLTIPIALLAGRSWKVIFSAALTTLIIFTTLFFIFGLEAWQGFLASNKDAYHYAHFSGNILPAASFSVLSAFKTIGFSHNTAEIMHYILIASVLFSVGLIWSKPHLNHELKSVFLLISALLILPNFLIYDLVIMGFIIVWLYSLGFFKLNSKTHPYLDLFFKIFLFFVLWAPGIHHFFAKQLLIPIFVIVLFYIYFWLLRKAFAFPK